MGNDQEHMKFPVKLSMGVFDTECHINQVLNLVVLVKRNWPLFIDVHAVKNEDDA